MASATDRLTEQEQAAARKAIEEEGLTHFAERIGIHEQTAKSVAGGFPGRKLTIKYVRQHLSGRSGLRL